MLLRDSDTGELRAYNIDSNQITGSAVIGKVGVNWEFSGVGNFSTVLGESAANAIASARSSRPPTIEPRIVIRFMTTSNRSPELAVIWIDHHEARVFHFGPADVERLVLHPD
jgi:hypothetical protein